MKWLFFVGLMSIPFAHAGAFRGDDVMDIRVTTPIKKRCTIQADDVNFRSTPYRERHNVIGHFDRNDVVYFLSEYTIRDDYGNGVETWYYVRRPDGTEGWVYSTFVTC